ncbi:hypothetical protein [Paenibacillus elgii]|uniref:hypothetical protein n=1 Tax=Paenibacillus elgii TaxID=189691 RepID=UPI00203ACC64|nr:hypothetical protein [Paenibacillus elgii]MCM3270871.1 hypothetical protein [Paenibacillus elgii]
MKEEEIIKILIGSLPAWITAFIFLRQQYIKIKLENKKLQLEIDKLEDEKQQRKANAPLPPRNRR